ncbi:hypothetical protein BC830DRAFT_201619 [Chytriomyces sp. MP71]|nr:hypothetical protein BC830DRAFT_201619 [Chytriomyces sp. MP71]
MLVHIFLREHTQRGACNGGRHETTDKDDEKARDATRLRGKRVRKILVLNGAENIKTTRKCPLPLRLGAGAAVDGDARVDRRRRCRRFSASWRRQRQPCFEASLRHNGGKASAPCCARASKLPRSTSGRTAATRLTPNPPPSTTQKPCSARSDTRSHSNASRWLR